MSPNLALNDPAFVGAAGGGAGANMDDSELKSYWTFNESSGTILNSSQSADSLGTDADLTLSGDPTYSSESPATDLGASVFFDGTGDFGVIGGDNSTYDFLHNSATMKWSINFWLKFSFLGTGANYAILDDSQVGDCAIGYSLIVHDNKNLRNIIARGVCNYQVLYVFSSTNTIAIDNWYMVTLRYDQSLASNNLSLNIDGANLQQFTKKSYAPSTSNATEAMTVFAKSSATSTYNPYGYFAECSIWDRFLTDAEMAALWNSGNGMKIYG